jgi:hypothetical protein
MKAIVPILLIAIVGLANAEQWEPTLATVSALRTGGAQIASSDALVLEDGKVALITYWEVRSADDLDVYRCVDIMDSEFVAISHECRKALRPGSGGLAQR